METEPVECTSRGGNGNAPPRDPQSQMQFAHFEFDAETDRLGEGPLSEVYRARDTKLGRVVALKILRANAEIDPAADQRFHREAMHASKLDHRHIATIFEYGEFQGTPFIAMEYLEGRPLDQILKGPALGYEECQRIALEVAEALAQVHKHGMIHRDLKPGNIMVLHDGTVKLLDFGIARASNESSITQHGMLVGTVLYMAPEQVRGDELDFRSDVFSLGSVLYHTMTRELPFPGKSFPEVCMAILDGKPRRPSLVRPGFPPQLEEFILKCLRPDPDARFQDAREAHGALRFEASLRQRAGGGPGKLDVTLLLPPIRCAEGAAECSMIAGSLRKDLAGELERIQGVTVTLQDGDELPSDAPFDFVLRAGLELDPPKGALDLSLERYHKENGSYALRDERQERVVQSDADEWALQADLVRTAVRRIRRQLTEFSLKPTDESARNREKALELSRHAHEVLLRGTTKHLMASISSFRRAVEADPYCAIAYAGLAEAMVRKFLYWDGDQNYLNEAREHARHALALSAECAEAHTSLGFAYHLSDHAADAQREYRIAIQLDNDEWLAHRLLGALLAREGNFKEAAPLLLRAIALKPDHIGSYDHQFSVLRRLDRYEESLQVADRGIAAAKAHLAAVRDNQEARLHMALLLARLKGAGEAREHVATALEMSPKDGFTSFHAGCVYAIIGDLDAAIDQLTRARDRGFHIRSELRSNTDLDVLRGWPGFAELVS